MATFTSQGSVVKITTSEQSTICIYFADIVQIMKTSDWNIYLRNGRKFVITLDNYILQQFSDELTLETQIVLSQNDWENLLVFTSQFSLPPIINGICEVCQTYTLGVYHHMCESNLYKRDIFLNTCLGEHISRTLCAIALENIIKLLEQDCEMCSSNGLVHTCFGMDFDKTCYEQCFLRFNRAYAQIRRFDVFDSLTKIENGAYISDDIFIYDDLFATMKLCVYEYVKEMFLDDFVMHK